MDLQSELALLRDALNTPDPLIFASQTSFAQQIEQEFTSASAIAPALYQVATRLVRDTEISAGGDVSCPYS
jgi:hypothetical protein